MERGREHDIPTGNARLSCKQSPRDFRATHLVAACEKISHELLLHIEARNSVVPRPAVSRCLVRWLLGGGCSVVAARWWRDNTCLPYN